MGRGQTICYPMAVNIPAVFTIALITIAFFISGASALIYQTLWVRSFSLTLGHTTLAVAAVLSSFMGGLAIGNFASGKISQNVVKRRYFLYLYGAVQAGVAIFGGLITPVLIKSLPDFVARKIPFIIIGAPEILRAFLWFGLTSLILIIPTTLMGATLPFLVRYISELPTAFSKRKTALTPSRITSFLITANTLGSVLGVIAAGFFLVKNFGMSRSYISAALLNIFSALMVGFVIYLDKKNSTAPPAPGDESQTYFSDSDKYGYAPPPPAVAALKLEKVAPVILFLAGAAAMVAEVSWTRVFSLILGSSTYAFSIMLAVFLAGFSAGNFFWNIAAPVFIKNNDDFAILKNMAWLPLALTGLSILGYMPLVNYLPYFFVRVFPYVTAGKSVLLLRVTELLIASSIMILPTFFMGMVFPWLIAAISSDFKTKDIGYLVGKLQSVNTIGNIIGSGLAGLFLIGFCGTEKTLVVASVLYILSSGILFYYATAFKVKIKICVLAAVFVILGAAIRIRPRWDPHIMTSGMFTYANLYKDFRDYDFLLKSLRTNWLLYYKDGVSANVAVFQTPWKERFMRINGKTDASSAGDMPTQLLLAYVPSVIVRPRSAENVLIVGLGSGITAGCLSVALKDVKNIECVEIEPAVGDAAKFFTALNHQILDKKFFKLIFTDARHYLAVTTKKYDIIISEPSNPWISGIANLFTAEAFKLGAAKLSDDGIFCQWLQSYSISEEDFKLVMRTFASVFNKVSLFATAQNDYLLVGTNNPSGFSSDYSKIKEMFEMNHRLERDLEIIGIHNPFSLITSTFMLDDKEFRDYALSGGDNTIHSDDKPTIEFTTPLYLYKNENDRILSGVWASKKNFIPDWIKNAVPNLTVKEKALLYNESAEVFLRKKQILPAKQALEEAFKIDEKNPRLWVNMGRVENLLDNHIKAEKNFKRATQLDPNYPLAWFHLGMLYYVQGLEDEARNYLEKGLRLSPGDPLGSFYLSEIYMKQKLYREAQRIINKALARPIWDRELRSALIENLSVVKKLLADNEVSSQK